MTTCCPTGYIYCVSKGGCYTNNSCTGSNVPAEDCPCCPIGNVYVDQDGYFIGNDPSYSSYGLRVHVSNPSPLTGIAGTCVTIVNGAWAIPSGANTSICPCCSPGQWYNNTLGLCIDTTGKRHDPVPCIECVCTDPPPPPECPTCSGGTLPVTFQYNENVKNCTNCTPEGETNLSPFKAFIADRLIAPIINFIRR